MNILASYNWLTEFLKTKASVKEFVARMTEVGNSVEQMIDVGAAYDHMVIGKILEVKAHPNADKLRVCSVDVGKKVEIVCGGINLAVDQLVAVALPGAKVHWHGEGDLVEMKETEIRGVKSIGMICAPDEIGFEKLQQGEKMIWDLSGLTKAKPGTPLAKALSLDDLLFDIEVTTNRPDAMSIVGLAREAGAAGLGSFTWNASSPILTPKVKLDVTVQTEDLCPRYQAVMLENVKVGPSPWWMQQRLLASGHRPINNVVDITNYVLHELGQPLHAFDADRIEGNKIVVRKAKSGEEIVALDGKTYKLESSMLVIADAKMPVAIAGVMGGQPTGTTEKTTRVIIEAASFDEVSVRRTARALNLYSDSSSQFEKGLSTESTTPALWRAVELLIELTGAKLASAVADERATKYKALDFTFDPKVVSSLIGVEISSNQQMAILKDLGFVVNGKKATVPYWRDHDIEASVDLAEEVARMYRYAKLPSALPNGEIPTPTREPMLVWERKLKELLKAAGASETYHYSFVSVDQLKKFGVEPKSAVAILNPLSDDWTHLRPSLVPSMLTTIEANQHRFETATLFELSSVHHPKKGDIPEMNQRLLIAAYATDGETAFLTAKGVLERVLRESGVTASFEAASVDAYWHPGRTARVTVAKTHVGTIGELAPLYAKAFGIDRRVVLADIDLQALLPHLSTTKRYVATPEFQDVKRDLSFIVSRRTAYAEVVAAVQKADALIASVDLADVYQGKGIDPDKKSMTLSLQLRAADKTLSSDEADAVMKRVTEVLQKQFSATMR